MSEHLTPPQAVLIGNLWQPGKGATLTVTNPADESVLATLAAADAAQVDAAVQTARQALPGWRRLPARQRGELLRAIASGVDAARERLIALQMRNNGKPRLEAELDVQDVIGTFDYYAGLCLQSDGQQPAAVALPDEGFRASVRREPVGVAALIVPWNFPMVTTAWKLAPALAAGCSVVLKPSELTPLAEIELLRIIHAAGLPAGVVNLVCGGGDVGAALSSHPGVDKISFTGSNKSGQAVMRTAAERMARVSLELGGKSALIVLDDAELEQAVQLAVGGAFFNAGQMCSATARILVAQPLYAEFVARFAAAAANLRIGGSEADIGPLISAAQYQRVQGYITQGLADGGRLLAGGQRPAQHARGYFLQPTVFAELPAHSRLWREEIFGPVACVRAFADDAEAVALANDSDFGLVATVVGGDAARAERLAAELEVGLAWVNSPQLIFPQTAWGGCKQSGLGRELGPWGLAAFQEIRHVVTAI
ncbi:aldehyde dehydrogenase family protein [Vogesella sp. LIG4]|uniref:aldehyde dehydrogenase family protein n=1 Tax=Vogesella sp. LIG4 TaxID=1192162 RepID=UPI00081F9683|nr:aldehyde dehydrogenase family protein [Vogesella sp. LIG4]SCK22575.1 betaine-aldehyde dehydrogenase [Vogesella sp. LIG4]